MTIPFVTESSRPPGWLPKAEFDAIFSRVPRLSVEVVIYTPERGVLLMLRDIPPNVGAWHIPGGTVLFGERVTDQPQTDAPPTFEQARDELAEVVRRLEAGGATLEESLALWERGEALAQVCQRWLDDARTRDAGGSGLGLAITRDIVERHGGTIHLADSPTTRFVLELPARP